MNAQIPPPQNDVIALADLRRGDAHRVGSKAAMLGELSAAGFAVPGGFAIPCGVLASDAGVTGDARAAVEFAMRALGGAVAIRSSGVAEDLADASFAGLYETVLNVRTVDEAIAAARWTIVSAPTVRTPTRRWGWSCSAWWTRNVLAWPSRPTR